MPMNKAFKSLIAMIFSAVILTDALTAATQAEQFFSTKKIDLSGNEDRMESGKYAIKLNLFDSQAEKTDEWVPYEQTIGKEKVLIHLPDKPVFTRVNDTWGSTIVLDGKVEYWLMAPVPAMSGVKEEHLFPMFIEKHSNYPYRLIESNITEENGLPILEITSRNKKTRKIEHTRVIVSNENFYVASIKFPKKKSKTVNPLLFLESVYVLK